LELAEGQSTFRREPLATEPCLHGLKDVRHCSGQTAGDHRRAELRTPLNELRLEP
jgi:hypothetical protein